MTERQGFRVFWAMFSIPIARSGTNRRRINTGIALLDDGVRARQNLAIKAGIEVDRVLLEGAQTSCKTDSGLSDIGRFDDWSDIRRLRVRFLANESPRVDRK